MLIGLLISAKPKQKKKKNKNKKTPEIEHMVMK